MKKRIIIISALVILFVGYFFLLRSYRKTIIFDVPNTPNVATVYARTVGDALKQAGIVYKEKVSRNNGKVYIQNVNKIKVREKVFRPQSDEFTFELLLNGKPVRLNEPIDNLDIISISEKRIVFY